MERFQTRGRHALNAPVVAALLAGILAVGCSGITVHQRTWLDRSPGGAGESVLSPPPSPATLIREGILQERRRPEAAIAAYREAALSALPFVLAGGTSTGADPAGELGPQTVYRRAIEYAVLTAHRVAIAEGVSWTEVLSRGGIMVRGKAHAFNPEEWDDAQPTRLFEIEGLRRSVSRNGLGAPLVLSRVLGQERPAREEFYPQTVFHSATAVLRHGDSPGDAAAVLELHDPVREPGMLWAAAPGVRPVPMAYDMTVPLARQLTDKKLSLAGVLGVLDPALFESRAGLYMMDPYQPGKIPVVFVHGLAASPESWSEALNELRGDPALRKRYQFWTFFYSTGNPIADSAARLREALDKAKAELNPDGRDPAFGRAVLIGHSMGGLLSRMSVSSSGMNLWNLFSKVPPEQLDLAPALKESLVGSTIFEPVPMVRRVVFVSTPHRGSPLGYEFAGRVASSLIRLPTTVTQVSKALVKIAGADAQSPLLRNPRQMTSVAQLASNNPMLQAVNLMPISPGVAYHSIVGFNGKGTLAEGGDGVVPYTSAHIDGALSELVVSSDHSAQQKEPSIVEMRRILIEHLREYDADRVPLALRRPHAPFPTRPDGPTPVRVDLIRSDDATPIARATEPLRALKVNQ